MSHIRFHEDIGLNSRRFRCNGLDHFWGDSVDARWHTAGNGSAAVVDGVDGGIVRLTSGATSGNSHTLSWQDIRSLTAAKNATAEYRIALGQTSNIDARIGLLYDATHYIYFRFDDSADDTWQAVSDMGAGASAVNTAVAPSTDYLILRIEASSTQIGFYVNGVWKATIGVTIPTEHLQPYASVATEEDADKTLDVDYVYWRQDR